ncbi:MAG: TatD family hydrolase [Tannerellaceae bacterium]
MKYYDIHSHSPAFHSTDVVIRSASVGDEDAIAPAFASIYLALGIHPWFIDRDGKEQVEAFPGLLKMFDAIAVGECGLDKCIIVPLEIQLDVFKGQIRCADLYNLPVILHVVKAWDEVLAVQQSGPHPKPWIAHGFRGNSLLAKQLMSKGILLSFGPLCDAKAVCAAWPDFLLAETDDSGVDLHVVYDKLADILSISIEELAEGIERNVKKVFDFDF